MLTPEIATGEKAEEIREKFFEKARIAIKRSTSPSKKEFKSTRKTKVKVEKGFSFFDPKTASEKNRERQRLFLTRNLPLEINTDEQAQAQLLCALESNDWKNPIFTHPLFIKTAMALFMGGKISYFTMQTLIERTQAEQPLSSLKPDDKYPLETYPILDDKGEFTVDAEKLLLSNLKNYLKFYDLTKEPLKENFKLLMRAFIQCNPGDNYFYIANVRQRELVRDIVGTFLRKNQYTIYDKNKCVPYKKAKKALMNKEAVEINALQNDTVPRIQLATGAHHALNLTCFKVEDYVFTLAMLGIVSTTDIRNAVRHGFRPQASPYFGVEYNTNVHGHTTNSQQTEEDHDKYHAILMSRMGLTVQQTLVELANVATKEILEKIPEISPDDLAKIPFCKATWKITDAEIFGLIQRLSNGPTEKRFCEYFETPTLRSSCDLFFSTVINRVNPLPPNSLPRSPCVSDLGIVWFISMAKNKEYWKNEIGFNPELMPPPYEKYYAVASKLQPYFKNDDPIYNILIYRTYLNFSKKKFELWKNIIDVNYDKIKDQLVFKRDNRVSFLGVIDKGALNMTLEQALPFTLLRLFDVNFNLQKDTKVNTESHLITAYLLLRVNHAENNFNDTRYLPLLTLLKDAIEKPECVNFEAIDQAVNALDKDETQGNNIFSQSKLMDVIHCLHDYKEENKVKENKTCISKQV